MFDDVILEPEIFDCNILEYLIVELTFEELILLLTTVTFCIRVTLVIDIFVIFCMGVMLVAG